MRLFLGKKVWWKCSVCGYEWKTAISARTRGIGCPACSNKTVWKGHNDLAVTGFTSVFDGLLSDISHNSTTNLKNRIDVIKKKIEKDETLDHDEYATLSLAITLEKALDSFSAFSDFSKKEPKELNRHWIAHGRSTRKRTKLDCVKMINLIAGLLLINDLESMSNNNG